MKVDVAEKAPSVAPHTARRSSEWMSPALVVAVFAVLLGVWHSFDHSLPAPDDASYIMGSFQYADLIQHPKFWRADWWYSMLTVNRVYPPTTMLFNGILRVVFGFGGWVNVLSVILFSGLLTATVYGTTRLLTADRRAAIMAAVLINLYPQTSYMFHGFALDAPLMAMISCGLFILLWWRSAPSWRRAIVCGLVLGLACLSKQIAAAYLFVPGVFCLIESVVADKRAGRPLKSLQVLLIGALAACTGLPWLLVNVPYIKNLATDNQSVMGAITVAEIFPRHMSFYISSMHSIMSPLLLGAFLVSLVVIGKEAHKKLAFLGLSAISGILLLSTLTWSFPSLRYNAPAMIATAGYTGFAISRLLDRKWSTAIVGLILAIATMQFVSFNFAPYPLSKPELVKQFSETLGVTLVEHIGLTERDQREIRVVHSTPTPEKDWGQAWAINTIDRIEGRKPVYLNILPDYIQLNGNTFELLTKMMGSPVRPTTARRWTVMGDVITFDPKIAMYCQWYLLKTGGQGNLLRDEESERNYARLIDFVENSGNYSLVDTHTLPDGSTMSLYRQTTIALESSEAGSQNSGQKKQPVNQGDSSTR